MHDLSEAGLAAWRLAHLLVNEDGPWALLARLRYRAGLRSVVRKDEHGNVVSSRVALNPVAELLSCIWCVSLWCAAFLLLPWRLVRTVRKILAIAALAVIVQKFMERQNDYET